MVCQWGPKIHFSQLFLLLKIFGEELGGDFTSGYGYLSDTEEQGGKNDWKELSWYLSDTEDQGGRTYKKNLRTARSNVIKDDLHNKLDAQL